ncbi:hypothetical protein Goari_020364 [Gossypium aridum]|uniref:DUF4283 domain-containing protein n=1 Tax=Gossypium aridum TaxID=34290 RepID=A0A7J8YPB0_GOSAI|nr:hypothetical protein [Gossypium aridum]
MEESIVGLPIEDKEEETILLGVESSDQENFYANCFVGIFLTSNVFNFQAMRTMLENYWHPNEGVSILDLGDGRFLFRLYFEVDVDRIEKNGPGILISIYWCNCKAVGKFSWVFLEYDALAIQLGYKRIMRALHPRQEYEFQWDFSLRAQPIKNTAWRSRLVEDDAGRISNYGNSTNKSERSNLGISQPVPMNQRISKPCQTSQPNTMKLISWNVRGLGRTGIVRLLHALRDINLSVVFFIETKLQGFRMVVITRKCGFQNGIDVDSDGRRGDKDLEEKAWRCTGFYGAPEENLREVRGVTFSGIRARFSQFLD